MGDACIDALIEQLAALAGESPAGLLTAGARRGTLLRLLEDAVNRSREAGRLFRGLSDDLHKLREGQGQHVVVVEIRTRPADRERDRTDGCVANVRDADMIAFKPYREFERWPPP